MNTFKKDFDFICHFHFGFKCNIKITWTIDIGLKSCKARFVLEADFRELGKIQTIFVIFIKLFLIRILIGVTCKMMCDKSLDNIKIKLPIFFKDEQIIC